MANETILSNLINPEVIGARLEAKLTNYIKFAPLARMGYDLQGNAGNTITVPYFEYIGDATAINELTSITPSVLNSKAFQATIIKAGKAVEISDEAVLNGYGDPIGEIEKQLGISIGAKIDADCLAALGTISGGMISAGGTESSSNTIKDMVADALIKFGEDIDETTYLLIEPAVYASLRKDADFVYINNGASKISGVVGEIYGTTVIVTNKLAGGSKMYLIRENALGIEFKRGVSLEMDRDILKKTTIISADSHYVAYLRDANKAVQITYTLA
jgi:N4-gp56 family major capsid protein